MVKPYGDKLKSKKGLREYIKRLPPNKIVLFLVNAKKYAKINMDILKIIISEKKFSGIYIAASRPYTTLIKDLKSNEISVNDIFFIDCVTKMVPTPQGVRVLYKEKLTTKNCLYITSPANLTELGVLLSQAFTIIKNYNKKFLFLDSLSTLLIYNDVATIAKFVHFLTTRLRLFGLVGIIMSMEREIDKKLLLTLSELCDYVVEVV